MASLDISELERLFARGQLILCVGPDLSVEGKLCTPLQLAHSLAGQLRELDPHADLRELDEQLAAERDDHALGILRHRFGSEEFIRRARAMLEGAVDETPELARLIAGVASSLHAVYTTNLDRLLERAFGNRWWIAAEGRADLAGRERVIVKLFGTAGRPETWVLTARDHERAYAGHDERRATLEAAYRSFPILFLGFDRGPAILQRLLAAVGPALAHGDPPKHFLATDLASHGHEGRRELEERGLRLVPAEAVRELLRRLGGDEQKREAEPERPQPPALASPYPGLEPYTEALAAFFFGRDEELARAVGMLGGPPNQHRRWLSIEGPSGVGKSSFVCAGLVGAVRHGQVERGPATWKVLIMRPGKRPLLNLATELCRLLSVEGIDALVGSLRNENGLSGFLREHVPPGVGLLMVVDQLEELLTFSEPEQRGAFADALADALDDVEGPLYLVTTLRSDFAGEFTAQEHALARVFGSGAARYILRPMSEAELHEVIVRPAKDLGVQLEHRLLERILRDAVEPSEHATPAAAAEPKRASEGALPLVAHVLRGLWDDESATGQLTLEAYERLGGISGALTRSADRVLEALPKPAQARAREVLLMLVNVDVEGRDSRRARTREEVLEKAGGGEVGRKLLMHLSGNVEADGGQRQLLVRLIALDEGAQPRVDLVHEALTREWVTMRGWLTNRRKELIGRADLDRNVRRWREQKRPWLGLPGGLELEWMLEVEAENDEQRAYQRALRGVRRVRVGSLIAGIAAVGIAALAFLGLYVQSQDRLQRAVHLVNTVVTKIDPQLEKIPGTDETRRELLELLDLLAVDDSDTPSRSRIQMSENLARGDAALEQKDLETAREAYEAALGLARELHNRGRESDVLEKLGNVEVLAGRLDQARTHIAQSLQIVRALEADPRNARYRRRVGGSLEKLGEVEEASGRMNQARALFDESLQHRQALADKDPGNAILEFDLVLAHMKLVGLATKSENELEILEHLQAADLILDRMEERDQLAGFEERVRVRAEVNQLMGLRR